MSIAKAARKEYRTEVFAVSPSILNITFRPKHHFPNLSAAMFAKSLRFLCILILTIGVFCRFVALDQKIYWYDEVSTSLTVSGYTELDVVRDFAGVTAPIAPSDLQKYQQIKPGSTFLNSIDRLTRENPHHPPLYYVLARFWAQVFGTSIAAMRALPAVISVLMLPAIYWLCVELFGSATVGYLAMVLLAVSPLQLAYAQEARQYTLWMLTMLLSSAALLRAIRVKTPGSWRWYGGLLVLGLYSQMFFGLTVLAHGVYVAVMQRGRFTRSVKGYLVNAIGAGLAFSPWFMVMARQYYQANRLTEWTWIYDLTPLMRVQFWLHNISLAFVDLGHEAYYAPLLPLYLGLTGLVIYAIYGVCRRTAPAVWLFLLLFMGMTALPFMLPDVLLGGKRTVTPRYFLPAYLGIELVVAHLLHQGYAKGVSAVRSHSWVGQWLTMGLVTMGLVSTNIYFQHQVWWTKPFNIDNPTIAAMINRSDKPFVVNNGPVPYVISLSYELDPKVRIALQPYCVNCLQQVEQRQQLMIPPIPAGVGDIFLVNAHALEPWKNQVRALRQYRTDFRFTSPTTWLVRLIPQKRS
jgi:uncharacterized membrane protein